MDLQFWTPWECVLGFQALLALPGEDCEHMDNSLSTAANGIMI